MLRSPLLVLAVVLSTGCPAPSPSVSAKSQSANAKAQSAKASPQAAAVAEAAPEASPTTKTPKAAPPPRTAAETATPSKPPPPLRPAPVAPTLSPAPTESPAAGATARTELKVGPKTGQGQPRLSLEDEPRNHSYSTKMDPRTRVAVEARAKTLLDHCRADRWAEAAPFADILAGATARSLRMRLKIPDDASREEITSSVAAWFKQCYGRVRPGPIMNVAQSQRDPNYVRITYRHGDLDAFMMRRIKGDWYYFLD